MDKAVARGLRVRPGFSIEPVDPTAPVTDSYADFVRAPLRLFNKRFYRPIAAEPEVGPERTTSRINETIDASVFERWRGNPGYRPENLKAWSQRFRVDPAALQSALLAGDPGVAV